MNGKTGVTHRGKSYLIELSDDKLKNEIMRLYGDRFSFVGLQNDSTVDQYIKKVQEGQYQMKVWNEINRWGEGIKFAEIACHKNNTDKVLTFTKDGDQWRVCLHERRYYGQSDIETQIQ